MKTYQRLRRNSRRRDEDYNVLFDAEGYEVIPEKFKKVNAVVVSSEYDEPAFLTREGVMLFDSLSGELYSQRTPRHHPVLVWMALRRPRAFRHEVNVQDVPGGKYLIEVGAGGYEQVVMPESQGWVTI